MTTDEEAAEKGPVEPGSGESPLDEVAALQAAHAELNERFLRLAADFDNYRKRMAKEQAGRVEAAIEQVICEMLEVYDNLERAERADDEALRTGLSQIRKLFAAVLERRGVSPIACINERFDPSLHEAVAVIPSDSSEGTVIDEVARGYCMNGRVIRYAKVAVSQKKE